MIRQQFEKYRRYEGEVLRRATKDVAVSDEDASLLENRFGIEGVAVVDNGVDTDYFRPAAGPRDQPQAPRMAR